jgi:hypothetical protein
MFQRDIQEFFSPNPEKFSIKKLQPKRRLETLYRLVNMDQKQVDNIINFETVDDFFYSVLKRHVTNNHINCNCDFSKQIKIEGYGNYHERFDHLHVMKIRDFIRMINLKYNTPNYCGCSCTRCKQTNCCFKFGRFKIDLSSKITSFLNK